VNAVNDAPVITSSASFSTDEDTTYNGQVTATDVDNDTLTYSVSTQPNNGDISLNSSTWEYTYTPDENYNWPDTFEVVVSDDKGVKSVVQTVNATINSIIDKYELINGIFPTTAKEWELYSHTFTVKDVDSVVNEVLIVNKPDWMTLDNLWNGQYSMTGTPGYDDAGTYKYVKIRIEHDYGAENMITQDIVVENTNQAPVLSQTEYTIEIFLGDLAHKKWFDLRDILTDDSTKISDMQVVYVDVDTSVYKIYLEGNILYAERIDGDAWDDHVVYVKFRDEDGWESQTLKLNLINFDNI